MGMVLRPPALPLLGLGGGKNSQPQHKKNLEIQRDFSEVTADKNHLVCDCYGYVFFLENPAVIEPLLTHWHSGYAPALHVALLRLREPALVNFGRRQLPSLFIPRRPFGRSTATRSQPNQQQYLKNEP